MSSSIIFSWSKQRLNSFDKIGNHCDCSEGWLFFNSSKQIEISCANWEAVNFGSWSKWSKTWAMTSLIFDSCTSFLNKDLKSCLSTLSLRLPKDRSDKTPWRVTLVMKEASRELDKDFDTKLVTWKNNIILQMQNLVTNLLSFDS